MWLILLVGVYCIFIVAASLLGGWLPVLMRLSKRGMQLLMCLVAGLMVGVAILHLIPHSFAETGSIDATALWTLGGLLAMWALVRLFHFHQHVEVDEHGHIEAVDCEHDHGHEHHHDHDDSCDHHHDHTTPAKSESSNGQRVSPYNWVGVAFGLGLHTLIDGIALGAAVISEAEHGHAFPLYGIGVFLAIALHKPMDALAITALMHAGGWPRAAQSAVNLGFAAMCPLGAFAFIFGAGLLDHQHFAVGCALGFSAGVFLWIALGDLLPDVHFHSDDGPKFAAAMLLGVLIAWGIGYLEPEHAHGNSSGQDDHGHDHGEHGHDHKASDHTH